MKMVKTRISATLDQDKTKIESLITKDIPDKSKDSKITMVGHKRIIMKIESTEN